MMNIEEIREYALSLPEVTEEFPFGPDTLVFKTLGKIFLLISLDGADTSFNVKCNPDLALELREQYHQVKPGYHMNKKHWNTITVDSQLKAAFLQEQISNSYRLVRGKK